MGNQMSSSNNQEKLKRNLKIKTDVCVRLYKDVKLYEQERETQIETIAKLESENADFYDIKQQKQILEEMEAMIPDCTKRLKNGLEDLHALLSTSEVQSLGDDDPILDRAKTEFNNLESFLDD